VVRAAKPEAEAKKEASPIKLDLKFALGNRVYFQGRGLDTRLTGELRLTGTPGTDLRATGTIRTLGGTYKGYGQNLAIERGVIVFNGDVSTPRLDILAVRPDIDTRVGVTVQGSAANPRIRLYSEPEMSEMDKLSWLVLGRAPSGLGSNDTALLQRAAMALLAGEGGGQDEGVLKKLGLDELSVSGVGSGDLSNAVVTVGKQLSKRLFVGYERGINSAAGSWNLIYRIARRFTLRAKGGSENALDAIWTWRWD
jgi:translocation and assembly module TamB